MPVESENPLLSSNLQITSTAGVIICVLALLLFSISSLCNQCYEQIKTKIKRKDDLQASTSSRSSSSKNAGRKNDTKRIISISDEQRKMSFQIPSLTKTELVQDKQDSRKSETKSSVSTIDESEKDSLNNRGVDETSEDETFLKERVQPSVEKLTVPKKTSFAGMYGIKKDLYRAKRMNEQIRSQSLPVIGKQAPLGRIWFQLYYTDQARSQLTIFLRQVDQLETRRTSSEETSYMLVNMNLLPERSVLSMVTAQRVVVRSTKAVFEEKFIFKLKPEAAYEVPSRTLDFDVTHVDKNGKETSKGEARMSLLNTEIYTDVPTDVYLRITPVVAQDEIGDVYIVLNYLSDEEELSVDIERLLFPSGDHMKNADAVRVKARLFDMEGRQELSSGQSFQMTYTVTRTLQTDGVIVQVHQPPNFEKMAFHVATLADLPLTRLKLKLAGYRGGRKHRSLGHVIVNCAGAVMQDSDGVRLRRISMLATCTRGGVPIWYPIVGARSVATTSTSLWRRGSSASGAALKIPKKLGDARRGSHDDRKK